MSAGFALLQRFLRETSGLSLDEEKRYLVEDRLQPILRSANIRNLDDLAGRLHGNAYSELGRSVAEALTINETSFFRDRTLFKALAEQIFPDLIAARKEKRKLRIWSAGCSTGQEPYSLAMMIDEQMRQLAGWQIDIVATDFSRPIVETAQKGLYSQFEVQRGLPVTMLLRYFRREDEHWQISEYLRAKVAFKPQNLLTSFRDLGQFDIILCRNVMIYFDAATKHRVLRSLGTALNDDGVLFLGAAERVAAGDELRADHRSPYAFVKAPCLADDRRMLTA